MTLADEFFTTLKTNNEIQWLIICFYNNYPFYYKTDFWVFGWNPMVSLKHGGTVPLPNQVLPGRELRNKPAL